MAVDESKPSVGTMVCLSPSWFVPTATKVGGIRNMKLTKGAITCSNLGLTMVSAYWK